jgi:hypothetical protein
LKAVKALGESRPDLYQRLRLHFFGTSNQTHSGAPERVLPVAREIGVADCVTEVAARIDYLDALTVQVQANAILMMGSSERHYTASKLYPGLLARRPILAVYHDESTVVRTLRDATRPPTVCVVAYDDDHRAEDHVGDIASHLSALMDRPTYAPTDVNLAQLDELSAHALAGRLAECLDAVVDRRARTGSRSERPLEAVQ